MKICLAIHFSCACLDISYYFSQHSMNLSTFFNYLATLGMKNKLKMSRNSSHVKKYVENVSTNTANHCSNNKKRSKASIRGYSVLCLKMKTHICTHCMCTSYEKQPGKRKILMVNNQRTHVYRAWGTAHVKLTCDHKRSRYIYGYTVWTYI